MSLSACRVPQPAATSHRYIPSSPSGTQASSKGPQQHLQSRAARGARFPAQQQTAASSAPPPQAVFTAWQASKTSSSSAQRMPQASPQSSRSAGQRPASLPVARHKGLNQGHTGGLSSPARQVHMPSDRARHKAQARPMQRSSDQDANLAAAANRSHEQALHGRRQRPSTETKGELSMQPASETLRGYNGAARSPGAATKPARWDERQQQASQGSQLALSQPAHGRWSDMHHMSPQAVGPSSGSDASWSASDPPSDAEEHARNGLEAHAHSSSMSGGQSGKAHQRHMNAREAQHQSQASRSSAGSHVGVTAEDSQAVAAERTSEWVQDVSSEASGYASEWAEEFAGLTPTSMQTPHAAGQATSHHHLGHQSQHISRARSPRRAPALEPRRERQREADLARLKAPKEAGKSVLRHKDDAGLAATQKVSPNPHHGRHGKRNPALDTAAHLASAGLTHEAEVHTEISQSQPLHDEGPAGFSTPMQPIPATDPAGAYSSLHSLADIGRRLSALRIGRQRVPRDDSFPLHSSSPAGVPQDPLHPQQRSHPSAAGFTLAGRGTMQDTGHAPNAFTDDTSLGGDPSSSLRGKPDRFGQLHRGEPMASDDRAPGHEASSPILAPRRTAAPNEGLSRGRQGAPLVVPDATGIGPPYRKLLRRSDGSKGATSKLEVHAQSSPSHAPLPEAPQMLHALSAHAQQETANSSNLGSLSHASPSRRHKQQSQAGSPLHLKPWGWQGSKHADRRDRTRQESASPSPRAMSSEASRSPFASPASSVTGSPARQALKPGRPHSQRRSSRAAGYDVDVQAGRHSPAGGAPSGRKPESVCHAEPDDDHGAMDPWGRHKSGQAFHRPGHAKSRRDPTPKRPPTRLSRMSHSTFESEAVLHMQHKSSLLYENSHGQKQPAELLASLPEAQAAAGTSNEHSAEQRSILRAEYGEQITRKRAGHASMTQLLADGCLARGEGLLVSQPEEVNVVTARLREPSKLKDLQSLHMGHEAWPSKQSRWVKAPQQVDHSIWYCNCCDGDIGLTCPGFVSWICNFKDAGEGLAAVHFHMGKRKRSWLYCFHHQLNSQGQTACTSNETEPDRT